MTSHQKSSIGAFPKLRNGRGRVGTKKVKNPVSGGGMVVEPALGVMRLSPLFRKEN